MAKNKRNEMYIAFVVYKPQENELDIVETETWNRKTRKFMKEKKYVILQQCVGQDIGVLRNAAEKTLESYSNLDSYELEKLILGKKKNKSFIIESEPLVFEIVTDASQGAGGSETIENKL